MPLVSRWGSKVTSVPAREPKANSPRPITLPSRPIAVDLEPTASSLGALVGAPIPVKDFSLSPQAPAPELPAPEPTAPAAGPSDLTASKVKYGVRLQGDSRIDLGNLDIFNFSDQPFTISAWVKLPGAMYDDESYDFTFLTYRRPQDPSLPEGYSFTASIERGQTTSWGTVDPRIKFSIFGEVDAGSWDQYSLVTSTNQLGDAPESNTWTHLMISYDGSKNAAGMGIWKNGVLLDTPGMYTPPEYTSMFSDPGRQLSVGSSGSYLANPAAEAYVDDIAIFDRVLSNVEAADFYDNYWSVLPNLSPVAYYSCGDAENGLGDSIENIVNNDPLYTGTLIGDATFVQDGAPKGYTK